MLDYYCEFVLLCGGIFPYMVISVTFYYACNLTPHDLKISVIILSSGMWACDSLTWSVTRKS